jgi:hypothetical protein
VFEALVRQARPVGREDHQQVRVEAFQKVHRRFGARDVSAPLRRIVRRAAERDGDDVNAAFFGLRLHPFGGDVVCLQNLRELRHPQSDEARVLHHVENIREGHAGKGVP